jgi:hypothetical protein
MNAMKTKRIALAGFAAAFLLSGCAALPGTMGYPRSAPFQCNTPKCDVTVTLVKKGETCTAEVDKEAVKVVRAGPVHFEWEISGPGEFANASGRGDGIDMKGHRSFNSRAHGAKKFKWKFENDQKLPSEGHKYDVTLTLNGKPCAPLDPYVMN